jgi:hypothetical protein
MEFSIASTYTLKDVIKTSRNNNVLQKALKNKTLAKRSKNLADTSLDPFELSAEFVKADPHIGERDNEYMVGVSKTVMLGGVLEEQRAVTALSNEADQLDGVKNIFAYEYGLKNIYHSHCIDYRAYKTFEKNYNAFVELYNKKKKAYDYQEISKKELLELEIEKSRLFAKLQVLKMDQQISKESLLRLSSLPITSASLLSCRDMYPIRSRVSLGETLKLSKRAYRKRLDSTETKFKRYSHALESVDVSMQYTQEIDINKVGLGVSIPLTFSSQKSEHERAAALYENSAIRYSFEQSMREKKNIIMQLKAQLKNQVFLLNSAEKNQKDYVNKLLPLNKKSYALGETSVIEYLLTQQRFYQLQETVYATQKAYYKTLFTLYTVSETKDKR